MNVYRGLLTAPRGLRDEYTQRTGRHWVAQANCIVLARSGAAARRAINAALGYDGVSAYRFNDWWSVTGNDGDIAAATAAGEGVPLVRMLDDRTAPWVRLDDAL